AVDPVGDVYVADSRVQKFSNSGAFIMQFGAHGHGPGLFNDAWGVATDKFGNVYVTDINDNRVQKFAGDGTFLAMWGSSTGGAGSGAGQMNGPVGIAVDGSGNVYVAELGNSRIQKFTSDGAYLTQWALGGYSSYGVA